MGSRRRRAMAAALLVALCVAPAAGGCGRKTRVRPPEWVAPAPIDSVTATNVVDGIRLSWRRPATYVDGSRMTDLGSFRIERAVAGRPFSPVGTIAVTDQERFQQERRFRWTDPTVAIGETYQYRVFSNTIDGYESLSSNVVVILRALPSPSAATPFR